MNAVKKVLDWFDNVEWGFGERYARSVWWGRLESLLGAAVLAGIAYSAYNYLTR